MKFIHFKNLSLMYVWQVSNYILSFVLTPYLARTLHASGFGVYSYCLAVNTYLWIMVEWGFPVGGVRDVATHRGDAKALQQVFWKIIYAKMALSFLALSFLTLFAYLSGPELRETVFISGLMSIAGAALASDWFAQGVEELDRFVSISIFSRVVATVMMFVFVRHASDDKLAAILHGVFGLFGGLSGFIIIITSFRFLPKRTALGDMWRSICASFSLFLAKANGILYVSAPPLIIGLLANTTQVGSYSGADKVARVCVMIMGPLSLVVAPKVFSSMQESKERAAVISGRFILVQMAISVPMALGLFIFAPQIISIVLGGGYDQSVVILRLLSPLPILIGVSNALGNQFLVPLGLDWWFAMLSLVCATAYLVLLSIMTLAFGPVGSGIALVLAELLMIGGALSIILRRNRQYLRDAWIGMRSFNPMLLIRAQP